MLGWHGIRRSLDEPQFLKAEFEAIKKVHDSGYTNVGVMLPMVISVDEIKKAKELLNEIGLEPLEEIEFGIMIETPSSVQIIKEICEEGIDFISIGSNDLTQFTLALDRNNAKVQDLFSELHPAVLKQIAHVIKTCREYNVETSICGQAGSNEEMAEFLVKSGIDSISANIDAVSKIKRTVAKVEKKLLLGVARKDFSYL
jgi:pyruvate,water dikinase